MLYAIAKINGKQYKLTESQELTVDRMPAKVGQKLDIKDVLLVSQDDTKLVGADAKKASIKAAVTAELLGPKVLVFKHKKRKRYRKLVGHRQALTRIKIESIDFPGKKAEKPVKESRVGSRESKDKKQEKVQTKSKDVKKEEKAATKDKEKKSSTTKSKLKSKK